MNKTVGPIEIDDRFVKLSRPSQFKYYWPYDKFNLILPADEI